MEGFNNSLIIIHSASIHSKARRKPHLQPVLHTVMAGQCVGVVAQSAGNRIPVHAAAYTYQL